MRKASPAFQESTTVANKTYETYDIPNKSWIKKWLNKTPGVYIKFGDGSMCSDKEYAKEYRTTWIALPGL